MKELTDIYKSIKGETDILILFFLNKYFSSNYSKDNLELSLLYDTDNLSFYDPKIFVKDFCLYLRHIKSFLKLAVEIDQIVIRDFCLYERDWDLITYEQFNPVVKYLDYSTKLELRKSLNIKNLNLDSSDYQNLEKFVKIYTSKKDSTKC